MYSHQPDDVWSSSIYIDPSRRLTTLDVLDKYMYSMMMSVPPWSSIIPASLLDGVQTSEIDRQLQTEKRVPVGHS
jgi:hypothetical protein